MSESVPHEELPAPTWYHQHFEGEHVPAFEEILESGQYGVNEYDEEGIDPLNIGEAIMLGFGLEEQSAAQPIHHPSTQSANHKQLNLSHSLESGYSSSAHGSYRNSNEHLHHWRTTPTPNYTLFPNVTADWDNEPDYDAWLGSAFMSDSMTSGSDPVAEFFPGLISQNRSRTNSRQFSDFGVFGDQADQLREPNTAAGIDPLAPDVTDDLSDLDNIEPTLMTNMNNLSFPAEYLGDWFSNEPLPSTNVPVAHPNLSVTPAATVHNEGAGEDELSDTDSVLSPHAHPMTQTDTVTPPPMDTPQPHMDCAVVVVNRKRRLSNVSMASIISLESSGAMLDPMPPPARPPKKRCRKQDHSEPDNVLNLNGQSVLDRHQEVHHQHLNKNTNKLKCPMGLSLPQQDCLFATGAPKHHQTLEFGFVTNLYELLTGPSEGRLMPLSLVCNKEPFGYENLKHVLKTFNDRCSKLKLYKEHDWQWPPNDLTVEYNMKSSLYKDQYMRCVVRMFESGYRLYFPDSGHDEAWRSFKQNRPRIGFKKEQNLDLQPGMGVACVYALPENMSVEEFRAEFCAVGPRLQLNVEFKGQHESGRWFVNLHKAL